MQRTRILDAQTGCLRLGPILLVLGVSTCVAQDGAPAADRIARVLETCAACHGENGVSTQAGVPSLAGQNAPYLLGTLEALRGDLRPSTIMTPIAATLEPADLPAIADHFAAQPYVRRPQAVDADKAARGREGYLRICQMCHPAEGRASTYVEYPLLAGQDLAYLRATMADILSGKRKANGLMREMIALAPDERIDEAIHFFAAQSVKPDEVHGARLDSPGAKRRRFKPAPAN